MKSSLLTGFWILSMFDLSSTLTVKICSTEYASKHIDCGESLITIQEVVAVYNQPLVCGPNVIGLGGNPSARCRNQQKQIFRRCYGRKSCEVKPADAILQLSGGCGSSTTNFLFVEYFCLLFPNDSEVRLPISGDITAETLHIFSPRFPNAMPPGQYSFTCTISPMVSPGEEVTLRFGKNVLIMNATSNNCPERLQISSHVYCNFRENWGEDVTLEVGGSVTMTYSKMFKSYGGGFWLQLTAVSASHTRVRLKIECPDQGQIPGDANNALTTSTQTSSLASKTSTDRSTSHGISTTSEDYLNTEAITDGEARTGVGTTDVTSGTIITAVTTMAMVNTSRSTIVESEAIQMNKDEPKGSGGLIGGLVGGFLVVIVAIVAVAVVLGVKLRKSEREKLAAQAGSPSNKNTAVVATLETYETIPDDMVIIENRGGHPYPVHAATDNGAYEEVEPSVANIPQTSRQHKSEIVTVPPGSNGNPAMPDVTENTPGQQYDDVADTKQYDDVADTKQYEPLAMVQYENIKTQPKVYAALSPEAAVET